ncbi:MAG: S-layer homology domain-containing protein, partial [Firmicutes bacterium]|nr:S-layer homology domain-containing protein [Bacillota bacterium]
SLEKALQWTEIHPIMLKYQQAGKLPGIDFNGYDQLKNQYVADGAMIGKEYSDYAQIVTAFNNAVALAKQKMASSSNTSASSGGGGGGSGFAIPSVKLPEPVEKDNTSQQLTVFSDMEDYLWANEAVSYLVEKGIISGVGDNMFAPSKGLTREEISTILVRTRKIDVGTHKSGFLDVPEDRWSYPYVSAVFESGLMVGLSNDLFGAESQITRNQYAVVMKRLIDLYGGEIAESPTIEDYADESSIPDWAIESVRYMKATGLMLGKTDSQFAGDEIVSRAYACDVLYSVLTALNYDLEEQQ